MSFVRDVLSTHPVPGGADELARMAFEVLGEAAVIAGAERMKWSDVEHTFLGDAWRAIGLVLYERIATHFIECDDCAAVLMKAIDHNKKRINA